MNQTNSRSTTLMAYVPGWGPYQQVSGWIFMIAGGWLLLRGARQLPALNGTGGWVGYLTVTLAAILIGMMLLIGHRRRNQIQRRSQDESYSYRNPDEFASAAYMGTGLLSLLLVLLIVTYLLV